MKHEFDFQDFPKMARLSRECVITEKLDGTNAQIFVQPLTLIESFLAGRPDIKYQVADLAGTPHVVIAASRTRYISPENDNFGFARWVHANAAELVNLGVGRHFGEWWGQAIQRTYGLKEKKFSLFNVGRWAEVESRPACCDVVPTLYRGLFDTNTITEVLENLRVNGSVAAPGFMDAEGIIIHHLSAKISFKKTLDGDAHKGNQPV